jgi:hypothetical protein
VTHVIHDIQPREKKKECRPRRRPIGPSIPSLRRMTKPPEILHKPAQAQAGQWPSHPCAGSQGKPGQLHLEPRTAHTRKSGLNHWVMKTLVSVSVVALI